STSTATTMALLSLHDALPIFLVPVMIVNGTSDLQIGLSETELLQKAKPEAKYLMIQNMNLVLKEVKNVSENQQSYSNPDFPVVRSEEHTSELQSRENLVCRLR